MGVAAIPSSLSVQQGNGNVLVTWAQVSGATSYAVQRSPDNVTYSALGTSVATTYLDTTATIGTQYFYQVASVNVSGTSGYAFAGSAVPTLTGDMSLGEIRTRARQRADRVGSNFVTDEEVNYYINQSAYELYDILINTFEDYYIAPRLLFQTTNTDVYDLPNGKNYSGAPALYKLYGVDCGLANNNNAFATLKKFDFIQRNRYVYPQMTSTLLGIFDLQYRLLGSQIKFIPTPTSGQWLGLWYYPRLNTLLQDTDVLDGISGWTEYVIVDAARKILAKEESPTDNLMMEKVALKQRIEESGANRDAGQPDTISPTRSRGEGWGMGGALWDGPLGGM